MNKCEYCVFIGRFSIFHKGHQAIANHAFELAKKVIIVIGSSGNPRNVRNPWTALERQNMIISALTAEQLDRVIFIHMKDYTYNNNMWVSILQEKINVASNYSNNINLIGFESDETSFYLKLFPQFKYIEHGTEYNFHSTQIRNLYFSHDFTYKNMVPDGVSLFLENFKNTENFKKVKNEKDHVDKYKEAWRGAPFTPIFVTVDNLVLKSGHILLVRRGHNPGKGLLALPGGFVNAKENLEDAALRELKEETSIKINLVELRKSIKDVKVFDDPMRSLRGRCISHTFFINLGIGALPKVKEGDDAAAVQWLPLSEFHMLEDQFFEDHFHIIRNIISKY